MRRIKGWVFWTTYYGCAVVIALLLAFGLSRSIDHGKIAVGVVCISAAGILLVADCIYGWLWMDSN